MSDWQLTKDDITLVLEEGLTCGRQLYVSLESYLIRDVLGILINEKEAITLICHLIKVFHIPQSDIEVIAFMNCNTNADKAAVLREAADRLAARGEE